MLKIAIKIIMIFICLFFILILRSFIINLIIDLKKKEIRLFLVKNVFDINTRGKINLNQFMLKILEEGSNIANKLFIILI